jgi:hypothetical protein
MSGRRAVVAAAALVVAAGAVAIWLAGRGGEGGPPPGTIAGITYYVSPRGSDDATGTSPRRAWRTVAHVTLAQLRPGDGVLFEGGATFDDATLEVRPSGTAAKPIVYGSYGPGRARLPQGVFLAGAGGIVIQDLEIAGADQGIHSAGSSDTGSRAVTIQRNRILDTGIAINSAHAGDADWTIQGNEVARTRDSGLIVSGEHARISANSVSDTGRDQGISYGKHGIYLKGAHGTVTGNRIRGFADSGVSVRRRDSRVEGNDIQDGPIGISWFQEDPAAGTSHWVDNRISATARACIYVSPSDAAGPTRESFVITGNRLARAQGRYLALAPTTGSYTVADNVMQ